MLLGRFESTITTDGKTGTHALPTGCRRSVAALMSGKDQQDSASRRGCERSVKTKSLETTKINQN